MRTTHLIILTMAAVSLMGCNPKETVNALTSDQNVTQKMAVRFAENMVGLPRALVVSDARKAAPGDKVTVKGAVIGDDPVFSKNIASFTIGDPAQLLVNMKVTITGTIDPHSTPEHPVLNIESIVIE